MLILQPLALVHGAGPAWPMQFKYFLIKGIHCYALLGVHECLHVNVPGYAFITVAYFLMKYCAGFAHDHFLSLHTMHPSPHS